MGFDQKYGRHVFQLEKHRHLSYGLLFKQDRVSLIVFMQLSVD